MAAENVSATRAPTPGVVMRRRTRLSARAMVNNRFLNGSEFQAQSCAGLEERVGDKRQSAVVLDQLADAVLERLWCRRSNL